LKLPFFKRILVANHTASLGTKEALSVVMVSPHYHTAAKSIFCMYDSMVQNVSRVVYIIGLTKKFSMEA
jgi:hypothetical protein